GSSSLAANNLAFWGLGAWWTLGSGGGNGVNGPVNALAVGGGSLYAGGSFAIANVGAASPVSAANVARWNGTTWSALGDSSGGGLTGVVHALALNGSILYVGGRFAFAVNPGPSSVSAHSVAQWTVTTNKWSALGPDTSGIEGFVYALALAGGNLYVGGDFTT